jgi:two-component SAPR family response regulator
MCAQILALLERDECSCQVVKSLKGAGHNVVLCANYDDALRFLQRTQVALIISDVHLENGGSVFDFLRWVKRHPIIGATPFVLFSCTPTSRAKYLEDGLKTSSRLLGAAKYITMDRFDSDEFNRQIDSLLPAVENSKLQTAKRKTLGKLIAGHRAHRYIRWPLQRLLQEA